MQVLLKRCQGRRGRKNVNSVLCVSGASVSSWCFTSFHLTLLILRLCRWTMALELNFHLLFPKSKHSHKGIPDLCCSLNYRAAKAHTIESDQASLWPAVTQLSEQDCSPGGTLLVLLLSHPLTCVLTAGLTFHFLFLRAFSYRKCDKWIWIHFFFFSPQFISVIFFTWATNQQCVK